MQTLNKHIILFGFKSVGKSVIGKSLAAKLHKTCIDLDEETQNLYQKQYQTTLTCRQIMQKHGQPFFREIESQALRLIMDVTPTVIALGGGAPLHEANQALIKAHQCVQIVAPRGVVFERIMVHGRPAFFSADEEPYDSFNRLWNEREAIYQPLGAFVVNNNGSIDSVVEQILQQLS